MSDKYEPCSICEEYIEGVICDKDKCPVGRMKKEFERLKAEIRNTDNALVSLDRPLIEVKSEAYKEFAERFNELLKDYAPYDTLHIYEIQDRIDIVEDILTEGGNEDGTNHS